MDQLKVKLEINLQSLVDNGRKRWRKQKKQISGDWKEKKDGIMEEYFVERRECQKKIDFEEDSKIPFF